MNTKTWTATTDHDTTKISDKIVKTQADIEAKNAEILAVSKNGQNIEDEIIAQKERYKMLKDYIEKETLNENENEKEAVEETLLSIDTEIKKLQSSKDYIKYSSDKTDLNNLKDTEEYYKYLLVLYTCPKLTNIFDSLFNSILNVNFIKYMLKELPFMMFDLIRLIMTDFDTQITEPPYLFRKIEDRINTVWIELKRVIWFADMFAEADDEYANMEINMTGGGLEDKKEKGEEELTPEEKATIAEQSRLAKPTFFKTTLRLDVDKYEKKYNELKQDNTKTVFDFIKYCIHDNDADWDAVMRGDKTILSDDLYEMLSALLKMISNIFLSFKQIVEDKDKDTDTNTDTKIVTTFYAITKEFIEAIFLTNICPQVEQEYILYLLTLFRQVNTVITDTSKQKSISVKCIFPISFFFVLAENNNLPPQMKEIFQQICRLYDSVPGFSDSSSASGYKKGGRKNTRKKGLDNVNKKTLKHIKYITQETLKHLKHLKTLKKETRKIKL